MQSTQLISVPHAKVFQRSSDVTLSTVQPQSFKVHYPPNGTGRDTYIARSSGGQFLSYQPYQLAQVGSFNQHRVPTAAPAPVMRPMAVHYHSDGTGRDSYIGTTSGGLMQNHSFVDFKTAFKQSLRRSDRSQQAFVKYGGHSVGFAKSQSAFLPRASSLERTDTFSRSQLTFYQPFYESQQKLNISQSQLTRKLSVPKSIREKVIGPKRQNVRN